MSVCETCLFLHYAIFLMLKNCVIYILKPDTFYVKQKFSSS